MRIFVLTQGIYSYEHIIGVYSDIDSAKTQAPEANWIDKSADDWMYGDLEGRWQGLLREHTVRIFAFELDAPAELERE